MTTGPYGPGNVETSAPAEPRPLGLPPEGVGIPVHDDPEPPAPGHHDPHLPAKDLSAELAERLWWVLPVLLIALGFLLGWADQNATSLKNDLRFPAMIAALLLFGQGGAEILSWLQTKSEEGKAADARAKELEEQLPPEEPAPAPTAPPAARLMSRSSITPTAPSGASTLAVGLMGLGVWLGLETLYVEKLPVVTLSLLAAFLLFTFGWKLLTKGQ